MKIVYKVVRRKKDGIYSAWMQGELQFQYHLSKINVPVVRNAPFATFNDIVFARKWRDCMFPPFVQEHEQVIMEVWKCAATTSKIKRSKFFSTGYCMTVEDCRRYWNSKPDAFKDYSNDIPNGTVFCSQLVFLEKVI